MRCQVKAPIRKPRGFPEAGWIWNYLSHFIKINGVLSSYITNNAQAYRIHIDIDI